MARDIPWVKIAVLGLAAALVAGVIAIVRGGSRVPDEIQPIEWNRQACAHCGMLIGEPAHASQLITTDGEVLAFDDPGCALRYLAERAPRLHRLWFHAGGRWLAADRTGFLTGRDTPMGSGLVAVDRETPNAIDLAAATRVARETR